MRSECAYGNELKRNIGAYRWYSSRCKLVLHRETWKSEHAEPAMRAWEERLVKQLKLSEFWIHNFLTRFHLTRHRVTTHSKAKPPTEAEVRAFATEVAEIMRKNGIDACDVLNMDETGMHARLTRRTHVR